jgi:hypothetical protein
VTFERKSSFEGIGDDSLALHNNSASRDEHGHIRVQPSAVEERAHATLGHRVDRHENVIG